MNRFWLIPIIPGMHLFGSCIHAAFVLGPSMFWGGFVLSMFGWYFLPFEAISASAIFEFYKPSTNQSKIHTIKIGFFIGLLGAVMFSPFIPKEKGSEINDWVGSILAGFSSMLFAFICTHLIKTKSIIG